MGTTMKRQITILLLLVVFAHFSGFTQELRLTNEAAHLCQNKDYASAEKKIAEALDSEESQQPYSWYVKGFIYKEIYKNTEPNNRNSQYRAEATESFSKSLEMDKKGEFNEMNKAGIKYLASTYYNDALIRSRDFDMNSNNEPSVLFNQFRKLMRLVDPTFPIKKYEAELAKNMAQRYFTLWQFDLDDESYADKSLAEYSHALRLDSLDADTYYNIAVIHYNRAVFKYRKIDAETDFIDLIDIQQECAHLIKNKALINMERAYALNPERGDVVRGLFFIHRALEHEKDVEYFKSEIDRLVKEGKLSEPFPE